MVNYRGPALLRRIVGAFEIPLFNRVNEINYRVSKLDEIVMASDDLARFHELEKVSVVKRGSKRINESDLEASAALVPPCRIAALEDDGNQIQITVNRGSPFGCYAQEDSPPR